MSNEIHAAESLMGLARLFKMAFDGADLTPLGQSLIERAGKNPDDTNALLDLSILLQLKYSPEIALGVQAQALGIRTLYHLPARRANAFRLLAIMAPGNIMANTPLEFLAEGADFSLDMLYIGPGLAPPPALPEYDAVFIALCETTENRPILEELMKNMDNWPCPVINRPADILKTSREAAPFHLASVAEILMPASSRVGKASLAEKTALETPFIIRPVDSHAGHGLAKINDLHEIPGYLETVKDPEFFLSPFIDYRSADGLYRKYRVALIGGKPYACHMGISENWMIHYLNAGMTESHEKRGEEARFMADFETEFGERHRAAFNSMYTLLNLDYLVLDCAETRDGKLLIFEIDTGAVIHAMDPVEIFPYKVPQMKKVFAAFHDMLEKLSNEFKRT